MKHLLILVTYKLKSGMRDAFLKTMSESGILEEVLKEDGIVRYHYYLDESNPDIILLVEEWLTAEHQKKAPGNTAYGKIPAYQGGIYS